MCRTFAARGCDCVELNRHKKIIILRICLLPEVKTLYLKSHTLVNNNSESKSKQKGFNRFNRFFITVFSYGTMEYSINQGYILIKNRFWEIEATNHNGGNTNTTR